MPPFWVGFSTQRKKPGWRRSSNCVQNAFFQFFPSWPDKKNSREIKFYNFGFMPPFCVGFSKQRKKPAWRRSSNCVQNAFFQLSRSGRSEKTALGSNFTISVSCHHFGWAFPSSGKSRVDEGRPIAFKTRFFNFSHLGQTKKTAVGSNFKISVSCHHFGWAFPSSGKSRVDEGRPIAFKTRFFNFSHLGQTKKTAVGSNFTISVSCHHFRWAFPSSGKSRVDEGRPIAFKTRFFNFSHLGQTKKSSRGFKFYNFSFMPPFWVGFSKQRKKPGWRRSSNCV